MAYQEHVISNLSEVPALVVAFAATLGWDVVGSNMRHPAYEGGGPGGLEFTVTYSDFATLRKRLVASVTVGGTPRQALIEAPVLATEAAPSVGVVQSPTKLFLIGMLTPQPYIAVVVEFGFNLYRHLYIGFAEKIGNYTGGEIVSACTRVVTTSASTNNFAYGRYGYLFNANLHPIGSTGCGGLNVIHADNPEQWRQFSCSGNFGDSRTSVFSGDEVFGGFKDSWNDLFIPCGSDTFSGETVLVPVNLLVSKPVTGDVDFIPVGRPSGVRMLNIENLPAQTEVSVGVETWKVFAAISKSSSLADDRPGSTGIRYPAYETSFYLGYAYRSA